MLLVLRQRRFPSVMMLTTSSALQSMLLLLLWTVLMPAQSSVRALRLTLAVPASVETGQNVTLACDHDPEGDELYAVKWYRQRTLGETRGREFVRYTPKEIPAVKFFPLHGVTVDKTLTNGTHVVLQNVTPKVTGKYTCEVSMDSPSFQTETAMAEMEVVVLPPAEPTVTGLKSTYALGETLMANCSLNGSIPVAQMDWKLNGIAVGPSSTIKYEPVKDANTKLMARTIGLHIGQLSHEHFFKGKLTIRCTGHIHNLYKGVKEVTVDEDRPQVFSPSLSYLSDDVHVIRNSTATSSTPSGQGMGVSVGVRYLDQTSQKVINDNTQAASARNWSSPRAAPSANWLQFLSLCVACMTVLTTTVAAAAASSSSASSSSTAAASAAAPSSRVSHAGQSIAGAAGAAAQRHRRQCRATEQSATGPAAKTSSTSSVPSAVGSSTTGSSDAIALLLPAWEPTNLAVRLQSDKNSSLSLIAAIPIQTVVDAATATSNAAVL